MSAQYDAVTAGNSQKLTSSEKLEFHCSLKKCVISEKKDK